MIRIINFDPDKVTVLRESFQFQVFDLGGDPITQIAEPRKLRLFEELPIEPSPGNQLWFFSFILPTRLPDSVIKKISFDLVIDQ